MNHNKALEIANEFLKEMNPNLWDGKGDMPDDVHPWLFEEEVDELSKYDLCLNICITDGWGDDAYRLYVEIVKKQDYSAEHQLSTESINSADEIANLIVQILE